MFKGFNPLTAYDRYIRRLIGSACRRRSAFHRQNYEKHLAIFRNSIKFTTKWYSYFIVYSTLQFGWVSRQKSRFKVEFYTGKKETFWKRAWQLRG